MPLPPLRSGHLNVKDAQCAETKDVLKKSYHIMSSFQVMGVQKGRFGRPKVKFSLKLAKFTGKIGIDQKIIFCIDDFFCAILSFRDMIDFVFFHSGLSRNLKKNEYKF